MTSSGSIAAWPAADVEVLPESWRWWQPGLLSPLDIVIVHADAADPELENDPEAQALLAEIKAGRLPDDRLVQYFPGHVRKLDGPRVESLRNKGWDIPATRWVPAEWWIARTPWRRLASGLWDHPQHRIARAPLGTPLPAGWTEVQNPQPRAPHYIDLITWLQAQDVIAGLPSNLTTVTVTEQPSGRWSYALGRSGYMRVLGEEDTQEQAAASGHAAHQVTVTEAWRWYRDRYGADLTFLGLPEIPPDPVVVIRERNLRF